MIPAELRGFTGQGVSTQAIVPVIGASVFTFVYMISLIVIGNQPIETTGAIDQRRAIAIAGIACWGFFAIATMMASGGPILNTVFYPGAIVTVVPIAISDIVGHDDGAIFSSASTFSIHWALDLILVVLPGIVIAGTILAGWGFVWMDVDARRAWCETNLPEDFREEIFVEKRPETDDNEDR